MNQQTDRLFREKLENFGKPVPANAWNRVETRLNKKNSRAGFLLKIAASITTLAIATVSMWPDGPKQDPPLASEKSQENRISTPEKPEAEKPIAAIADQKNIRNPETKKQVIQPVPKKQKQTESEVRKETVDPAPSILTTTRETILDNTVAGTGLLKNEPAITETSIANNTAKEPEGVTLIYSVEEVNEKYLDKKALAEATSGNRKPSTLRKLFDKAYDLKNNQDPFGDLRQKKNEILALNFKNEKQRSQNK